MPSTIFTTSPDGPVAATPTVVSMRVSEDGTEVVFEACHPRVNSGKVYRICALREVGSSIRMILYSGVPRELGFDVNDAGVVRCQ